MCLWQALLRRRQDSRTRRLARRVGLLPSGMHRSRPLHKPPGHLSRWDWNQLCVRLDSGPHHVWSGQEPQSCSPALHAWPHSLACGLKGCSKSMMRRQKFEWPRPGSFTQQPAMLSQRSWRALSTPSIAWAMPLAKRITPCPPSHCRALPAYRQPLHP